MPTITGLVSQQ